MDVRTGAGDPLLKPVAVVVVVVVVVVVAVAVVVVAVFVPFADEGLAATLPEAALVAVLCESA